MERLTPPRFPDDFRILHADGGASYWHWHPDAPPDYDGTWPADGPVPVWAGGLMISSEDAVSHVFDEWEAVIVVWEYGPETESGPHRRAFYDSVQWAVNQVIAEVNDERERSVLASERSGIRD